jgi:broad specificity phosphatase PhoE
VTKDELAHIHFDAAYSSDLQRAVETGEIIYGKPIPEDNQIHELRERHFGDLEGKPDTLLSEGNKTKATLPYEERWVFKHVPGMESDHEVSLRFKDALELLAKQNYGRTILVAAHGSAIRTMLMRIQNLTENELPPGSFGNAGYVKLSYSSDGFTVLKTVGVRYNHG